MSLLFIVGGNAEFLYGDGFYEVTVFVKLCGEVIPGICFIGILCVFLSVKIMGYRRKYKLCE